jgi:hypothetical protein
MTSTQIDNLLKFTLLFNKKADSYFINCDIDYIWEKYQKIIGFDPEPDYGVIWWEKRQDVELLKEWLLKWGKHDKTIDKNKYDVLKYICLSNTNDISPETIFLLFSEYIGDINKINSVEYKMHPLFEDWIEEYKEKYRREINLEILT